MTVTAPRYREDIEVGEPDLAEEVIREYGYDHIVPTFLKDSAVTNGGLNPAQKRRTKLKQVMVSQGYYEVSTLAFYSDADLDALHITADAKERNVIRLLNPITTNLSIMRTTLAPSMLNTVVENVKKATQPDVSSSMQTYTIRRHFRSQSSRTRFRMSASRHSASRKISSL